MEIKKIIIYGHKLHSHTHSYIHYGFYKAFKYLGYDTYWFDSSDSANNFNNFDFANSLFITEGQVINNMPIRDDCFYVLHNVEEHKHHIIKKEHKMILQVYTQVCIKYNSIPIKNTKCHYISPEYDILYIPWATDLLPYEIKQIRNSVVDNTIIKPENKLYVVGFMTDEWNKVKNACHKKNIEFVNYGATFNMKSKTNIQPSDNIKLIQKSIIAPAIQTKWQVDNEYIPCRIFKNISYGRMGATNNKIVNELFDGKLIFDKDIEKLIDKSIEFEKNKDQRYKQEKIVELMDIVAHDHTYINRIETLKEFIYKYYNVSL